MPCIGIYEYLRFMGPNILCCGQGQQRLRMLSSNGSTLVKLPNVCWDTYIQLQVACLLQPGIAFELPVGCFGVLIACLLESHMLHTSTSVSEIVCGKHSGMERVQ